MAVENVANVTSDRLDGQDASHATLSIRLGSGLSWSVA